MRRSAAKFSVVLAAWFLLANGASGQQATEVYIPIGQSPGVSANERLTGTIRDVDHVAHSIEIQGNDGALAAVRVNDKTLYYLDRSEQRRKNSLGTLHDCENGRTIEVKIMENDIAEWIKIEVD